MAINSSNSSNSSKNTSAKTNSVGIIPADRAAKKGPFFIVLNARSGSHDANEEQQLMARILKAGGRQAKFLQVTRSSPISAVAERAVALAKKHGGVVVAAGGDGTINAVASAVLESGCPFGVLPQGTFNYFGRVHGIPQGTEAATHALLNATISPVQAGHVNGRLFLVNASVGLYPELLENREAWKNQLGRSRLVAFVSGLVTVLRGGKQLDLKIETSGHVASLRTPTLFVGNNHLQLSRAGIDDHDAVAVKRGQLAAIVVRPIGTLALFWLLIRGLAGRLGDAKNIDSFAFRRLVVSPRWARSVKVATDGEVLWIKPPLVFEVAPEPLLLLVPALEDRAEVA